MKIEQKIRRLADRYARNLETRVGKRVEEMAADDDGHHMIYQVLGVSREEGRLIDVYQNKGRFLYNYSGLFLEEATRFCFLEKYPDSGPVKITNTTGQRPKTFGVDFLIGEADAIEIKWRDATTDGDHIAKERARVLSIKNAGYKPVRVMFYYPNRSQAQRIQRSLQTLYDEVEGEYHHGNNAWSYVYKRTGVRLDEILKSIARERANEN